MESGEDAEAPMPRRTRRSAAASQDGAGEGMPFQNARSVLILGRTSPHRLPGLFLVPSPLLACVNDIASVLKRFESQRC